MTNSGDFRRYSYGTDASYAVQAFNMSRSSAAPAYRPETKRELKVHDNKVKKTRAQLLKEQRQALLKAFMIFSVSVAVIAMFFGMLHTYAVKNELNHEISNLKTQLAVEESENTRINSELNALVSMNMIDQYAVEKLGMTKLQSNQIRYIDVSQYRERSNAPQQENAE